MEPELCLEADSWPGRGQEIYEKFFPCGLYTHFYIHPIQKNEDGTREVRWTYTFMDLGMCHTLEKSFVIAEHSILDRDTKEITLVDTPLTLRNAVFNHYWPFARNVLADLGIFDADPRLVGP